MVSCILSKRERSNLSSLQSLTGLCGKYPWLKACHIPAQLTPSPAVLCDLPVQQMCKGLLASVGKQRAVLPDELPQGKREHCLQVVGFF